MARSKTSGPAQRTERQRQAQRRGRVMLGCSVLVSGLMLAAWFPFSSLFSQHQHLSMANAQLASISAQDKALAHQQSALSSQSDIERLAREQYQLVEPGQRLVQVLPPSGTPSQAGAGQAPYPGDPGLTKPVAPSAIALLTTSTTTPRSSTATSKEAPSKHAAPGIVSRMLDTLAFWRR